MKRMMMMVVWLPLALNALAGTVFVDGKPCTSMGNVINCPGGGGAFPDPGQSEAARAARAETNRLKAKSRQLEECLRKADWPGSPGRSECQSLYGE